MPRGRPKNSKPTKKDLLDERDNDFEDDDESEEPEEDEDDLTGEHLISKEEADFRKNHQGVTSDDLDVAMTAFEPLMKANPKDWYITLWRVMPEIDSEGINCSGYMRTIKNKVIDHEWLAANHGGGTYKVTIHGAAINKRGHKSVNILRTVQGIEIAGPVKQNQHDKHYKGLAQKRQTEDSDQDVDDSDRSSTALQDTSIQNKLLEYQLATTERLEQKLDSATERLHMMNSSVSDSQVDKLRQEMSATIESLRLQLAQQPRQTDEAKHLKEIIEGLRKDNESIRQDYRDEIKNLQTTYENRINAIQAEHREYRKDANSSTTTLIHDVREQANARLENQRMMYNTQIQSLEQNYQTRIQVLEAQLAELKSHSEDARKELDKARNETHKVRIDGIQAALEAKNQKSDGLDLGGLQKTYESIQAFSSVLGFKRDETPTESAADKLLKVAGSVVSSDKFGHLMGALASRFDGGSAPPTPPYPNPSLPTPSPSTLEWDRYKTQRRLKRMQDSQPTSTEPPIQTIRDVEPQPVVEPEPAPQPTPEPPVDATEQAQAMVQSVVQDIEKAVEENKPVEDFVSVFVTSTGLDLSMVKIAVESMSTSQILSELGVSEDDLTLGARAYFDQIVDHIKKL